MGFVNLLYAASMPNFKVLIVIALGSFLALESIDILGKSTRKQLNKIVTGYVNINLRVALSIVLCNSLGWVLLIIIRPPQHLKGLVLGSFAAGNLGNMILIIIPAVCKEKASPFGDPDVCYKYGMAYASLSVDCGIHFFSVHSQDSGNNVVASVDETRTIEIITESTPELTSSNVPINGKAKVMLDSRKKHLGSFSRQFNLKAVFAPPTIGAIVGFTIGTIAPMRRLITGTTAPLHVIQDSASLVGDAAIPVMTLIVGGNLLKGLKGSGISLPLVCGPHSGI
ncbi:PIN-LIKES 3-like protein [Tanacetum coccineum]|uniref:PIN-LIKES 3-like protein n=1 Tax=Tanacetum coccineum TaxID=301880 RepID=A0ABQ5GZK8_9ASTR